MITVLDAISAPFLPRRFAAALILVLNGLSAVRVGEWASVVRTDEKGTVEMVSDGQRLWWEDGR